MKELFTPGEAAEGLRAFLANARRNSPSRGGTGMYGLTIFSDGVGPERFRRAGEIAVPAERAGFDRLDHRALQPLGTIATGESGDGNRCMRDRVLELAYGVGRTPAYVGRRSP